MGKYAVKIVVEHVQNGTITQLEVFHNVPLCACSAKIFPAHFPVTSHGVILVSGFCIAAVV
jgi:hypothetical protein